MTNQNTPPVKKSYLALRFAPFKFSANGQTPSVSGPLMVTTNKEKNDLDEPCKIPAGKSLKVLDNVPVLDTDTKQSCYLNAKWHMGLENTTPTVAQKKSVEIYVVQELIEGGVGDNKRFKPNPLGSISLDLGEIEVKRGKWYYKLVGDVHRCFWHKAPEPTWQPDVLTYKKLSPNLKYNMLVE